jgi:hypothetical protein
MANTHNECFMCGSHDCVGPIIIPRSVYLDEPFHLSVSDGYMFKEMPAGYLRKGYQWASLCNH